MNNDSADASLGAYLRAARTRAGLSLRELERLTGIANGYLTKLELNQKTNPSADVLLKLADALELDATELLAFVGIKPSSVLPPAEIYFRKAYGLSDAEARAAAELIEQRYGRQPTEKQSKQGPREEVDDEQPPR